MLGLVVCLEALRARPVANGLADRVAEVGRQPAAAMSSTSSQRPARWKPRAGPWSLRERVLELVAVVEDGLGRDDLFQRRLGDAPDAPQGVGDLLGLRLDLRLVREVLEPAPAALR